MLNWSINYKKTAMVSFLTASMLLLAAVSVYAQSPVTPSGSGSEADPYLISELGHLVWMADNVASSTGKYYSMTADIDASDTANWNDDGTNTLLLEGFKPIGNAGTHFNGIFEGDGHTITGLVINRPSTDYIGLFGYVGTDVQLQNLGSLDCFVRGHDFVGGIVGYCDGGSVLNCYASGTFDGSDGVGGLIGSHHDSTVSDSHATGSVTGFKYVGGLVGWNNGTISNGYSTGQVEGSYETGGVIGLNDSGAVSNCFASETVNGYTKVGGLVGSNLNGTVFNSYATNIVSGYTDDVGGLVGYFEGGSLSNCYATGAVSGEDRVGGLLGYIDSAAVSDCYAIGAVSGMNYIGGLIGNKGATATVLDSYWDTYSSRLSTSDGGTGKTTAEMKQQATFAGWDFTTIWDITEDVSYPWLRLSPQPFKLAVHIEGPGSVTFDPESPDGTYAPGTVVTLTATPIGPYDLFDRWLNAVTSDSAIETLVMDIHKSVTAIFLPGIVISTLDDLTKIGNDPDYPLDGVYALTADIDASETATWNDDGTDTDLLEGFKPIGDQMIPFMGIFDGYGHIITGLTINRPNTDSVGLFGEVGAYGASGQDWQVQNLGIINCTIAGYEYVGGLIGHCNGYFGAVMSNCYVTGTIIGRRRVGGLIGAKTSVSISYCYTTGSVTGNSYDIGGLIGYSHSNPISNCYSTSNVMGSYYVGGLIGWAKSSTASKCYAAGAVQGYSYVGGLIGYNTGITMASYWDMQTSGQSTSAGGTGKTTDEMMQQGTFVDWDFAAVWDIVEDETYPYLQNLFDDLDGDGVIDQIDACPNTVPGATVNSQGCPPEIPGDFNRDGDVDAADLDTFTSCISGPTVSYAGDCDVADLDQDGDVDLSDFGVFQRCYSGEDVPADPDCMQ